MSPRRFFLTFRRHHEVVHFPASFHEWVTTLTSTIGVL